VQKILPVQYVEVRMPIEASSSRTRDFLSKTMMPRKVGSGKWVTRPRMTAGGEAVGEEREYVSVRRVAETTYENGVGDKTENALEMIRPTKFKLDPLFVSGILRR
jgi:hypothetical protein